VPVVYLPTPLRPYANKQKEVEVQGATVGDALSALTAAHPDLKRHLFADDGSLRSFVNVYVNDEDIRHLQKSQTALKPTDVLQIVPSIAGGSF
jgi:MoaD family protein